MSYYTNMMADKTVQATPMTFQVSPENMLRRFLILGTKKNGYYHNAFELTSMNYDNVLAFAEESGWKAVVDVIYDVLKNRKAHRLEPSLFVLAMACSEKYNPLDIDRTYALDMVSELCVTFSHLTLWLSMVKTMRGFGSGVTRAIRKWLDERNVDDLDYQFTKYRKRNGFTPRDILRIAHPKEIGVSNEFFRYVAGKGEPFTNFAIGYEKAKVADEIELVDIINRYKLTHEMIPDTNDPSVWVALLDNMPTIALVRNLSKMSAVGLTSGSLFMSYGFDPIDKIVDNLLGAKNIHPGVFLIGYTSYMRGNGRHFSWNVNDKILNALQEAFYNAFNYLPDVDSSYMIGVDISGSMNSVFSDINISSAQFAALVAMTIKRQAKNCDIYGFARDLERITYDAGTPIRKLGKTVWGFGHTDVGQLIELAIREKRNVDGFVIITDNEVNHGRSPFGLLEKYNSTMGKNAKMISVATSPTYTSVLPDNNQLTLNLVGGDPEIPSLVTKFVKGEI